MKIAVYSGSFNPLHKGHLAIMRHLTEEAGFDRVYLVVTPQNPFKDAHSLPAGQARYEAAVEAVKKHPELKVDVLDIELKMTPPQYTIKTLDALREKEPHNDFTLVIGADNLASFQGWREHGRILKEYGVVVFPRKGFHRGHDRARLLKEDKSFRLVTISSTEIRNAGSSLDHWLM